MKELEMEKVQTLKVSSESDADENGENGVAAPKKRGRPPKKDGKKEIVEKSGRGRGRPPMNAEEAEIRKKAKEEKTDNGISNGKQRGRPKKHGALKVQHAPVATGKGRGRPKADNGENDGESNVTSRKKKSPQRSGRGRPKKEVSESEEADDQDDQDEQDEDEEEEEEYRPVGRPATGAVNLNIERTGRGLGRPKKAVAEKRAASDKEDVTPKKRGRPPTGNSSATKSSSGKPRGRPKSAKTAAAATEEEDSNGHDDDDEKNADDNLSGNQEESNAEDTEGLEEDMEDGN